MSDRYDPFEEIEELFDRMSSEFDSLGRQVGGRSGNVDVDVADTDDEVVVTADLPGFDTEDIDVTVKDRTLRITAEHTEEAEREDDAEEKRFHRRERTRRSVSRRVRLPVPVEQKAAAASYRNGVLEIRLPKTTPDEESHSIDIE